MISRRTSAKWLWMMGRAGRTDVSTRLRRSPCAQLTHLCDFRPILDVVGSRTLGRQVFLVHVRRQVYITVLCEDDIRPPIHERVELR